MDDQPRGSEFIRYWLYRLLGQSDTQAKWRLRERRTKSAPRTRKLRHRNCGECSQLLLIEEKICHRCGAKQLAPSWLVKVERSMGWGSESVIPCLAATMLAGYLIQIKMGATLFGGLGGAGAEVARELIMKGAAINIPLTEYFGAQSWRLFTYTCLHGNLMHIGFNLIALLQIGPLVARTFGWGRTFFIWLASGATAIILPLAIGPIGPTVGASGSVFGLIGCAMAFGHRVGTPQGLFIRNKMIEWTVFCTLFGLMMGGVAHSAHFGGLAGGAALSWLLPPARNAKERQLTPLLIIISLLFIGWSCWAAWRFHIEFPKSLYQMLQSIG